MRVLPFFCILLGCCLAAPSDPKPADTSIFILTDQFITNDNVIYSGKHDIVKIFVPFNQFPFKLGDVWADDWENSIKSDSSSSEEDQPCEKYTVFFVEADIKNGEKTDKGLYVQKNGKVTKLLDNGRDAIANNENVVYFGASDGIYKYNDAANTAEKHGTVTDNIIQLAFFNVTNTIYYVTANHELFKLNTEATSSVKVPAAKDVQAAVFGYDSKIYYYDTKNNVYVFDEVNNTDPVKITGLPATVDKIALISPVIGMEQGSILFVDKVMYFINSVGNGAAKKSNLRLEFEVTAYEPKPTLVQYLAKDKKLYELDVGAILQRNFDKLPEGLKQAVALFQSPIKNCKRSSL